MSENSAKTALVVISPDGFHAEEFRTTRAALRRRGISAKVVSTSRDKIEGGIDWYCPDMTFAEVNPAEFDAVVFIGGEGAESLANLGEAQDLARQMHSGGKLVAAIGKGVLVPGKAGILKGVEVTGEPEIQDALKACGARYTGSQIEPRWLEDNRQQIVTAFDSAATLRFGTRIAKDLGIAPPA